MNRLLQEAIYSCYLIVHSRSCCSERERMLWSSHLIFSSSSPYCCCCCCCSGCGRIWEDWCTVASCVPSQPGLVSGCRLGYSSSGGFISSNISQSVSGSRIAVVPCDNQTTSYNGTAYDSMSTALECPRSGMTKCSLVRCMSFWMQWIWCWNYTVQCYS